MNTCESSSTGRSLALRGRPSFWVSFVVVLAICSHQVIAAQAPSAPAPAEGGSSSPAAANLAGTAGVQAGMSSAQLIELAVQAAKSQRWADAEKILAEVIRQEPNNLQAYLTMAQVYEVQAASVRAGSSDPNAARKADSLIDAAVRTYLEYAAPRAQEAGNLDVSEQIFKAVLHLRPNNPQAELGMARVLDARGSMQAIDRYKSYINPRNNAVGLKDAQAHLELGRIYRRRHYINQAVATLEDARKLDPENPEVLLELAQAYQDANNPANALDLAKSAATEKAPSNAAYRNVYALVLLAQSGPLSQSPDSVKQARQNLDEARRQSSKAIELAVADEKAQPGEARPLDTLGNCYATYERVLTAVLSVDEADVVARVELATAIQEHAVVTQRRALYRALAVLQRAGEDARKNIAYLEKLAELQSEAGQRAAAAETCQQILKLDAANTAAKRLLERLGPIAGASSRPVTAATAPAPGRP
jgi:tetratricopeptide (TPR) repeat protein